MFPYTHLLAIFNLNCSLVFFFNSFSLYFFEKSTKNGAAVSGIRCFLCSRVALRHLSVGAHLVGRSLSQCLGWQELASLKHHATCFQALLGCSLCLPTLPFRRWRGITFCNKNSLVCITDFNAHYANILKPAPSKSQRTAGQAAETGQNLFERCIYAMLLLREKRVVLSPMLERTAVCGK